MKNKSNERKEKREEEKKDRKGKEMKSPEQDILAHVPQSSARNAAVYIWRALSINKREAATEQAPPKKKRRPVVAHDEYIKTACDSGHISSVWWSSLRSGGIIYYAAC